jgi:flagellar L-ring protein precursor FlgH
MSITSRIARSGIALLLLLLSGGCVEHALIDDNRPGDYTAMPEPELEAPEPGSIWRGNTASGSFLFFDRKARGVGDLITVLIVEDFRASGSAETKLGRSSSIDASLSSDIGITDVFQRAAHWFFGLFGDDPGPILPAGADVNALRAQVGNDFDGDGETTREGSFQGIVTCRVLQALPRGVFHIRGRRSIIVNHEEQVLTVEGLVRREDIGINNTVLSSALAEAKLAFDGLGVIDDKQRPSVVARMMDWFFPF